MGSRKLLKVKAHQADELAEEEFAAQEPAMQPCGFVVAGNRSADKEANEARELAKIGQLGGVKYCAGGERFFFTWQGGMIIEGLGQFVRERGRESALEEWAKRPAQGAVARAIRSGTVDGKSLELGRFRKPVPDRVLPERQEQGWGKGPFIPDRTMWKMRNYVGGSWTSFLHTRLFSAHHDGEGAATSVEGRWTTVDEICPLCLAGRGDQRHACMTCQHGELPALRELLWDKVEATLAENPGEIPWERRRGRGLRHPAGTQGRVEAGQEER